MRIPISLGNALAVVLSVLTFDFMGVRWATLIRAGGLDLTLAEVCSIVAVMLFAVTTAFRGRLPRFHIFLYVALLHALILASGFIAHGTPGGLQHIPRYLLAILSAAALYTALQSQQHPRFLMHLATAGVLILSGMIFMSAREAGVDLLASVGNYLTTLNRDQFKHDAVRALLNAFNGESNDLTTTLINLISAAYDSYAVILLAYLVDSRSRMSLLAWPALALALLFLVVLFSFSALLVLGATVLTIVVVVLIKRPYLLPVAIASAALAAVVFVATPVGDMVEHYLAFQVTDDEDSRTTRLAQYAYALSRLNESIGNALFGVGYTKLAVGDYEIHNLTLFSWLASGLPGLLMVVALYGCMAIAMLDAARRMLAASRLLAHDLIQFALPMIFVIRTLFGGGGGIPGDVALFPAVIAIVLSVQRRGDTATSATSAVATATKSGPVTMSASSASPLEVDPA